eukprot:1343573-Pyramimonas_sp.AAC.1
MTCFSLLTPPLSFPICPDPVVADRAPRISAPRPIASSNSSRRRRPCLTVVAGEEARSPRFVGEQHALAEWVQEGCCRGQVSTILFRLSA